MICIYCGRDIEEIGQCNMSEVIGEPLCEDCHITMLEVQDYCDEYE